MKTQINKTLKVFLFLVTGLMAGMLSVNVSADDRSNSERGAQLMYQSSSINHNIFSYLSHKLGEVSLDPKIIYVSQANGQAIHSYAHSGSEITNQWHVEYVDTAYNPAIYSYEGPLNNGNVILLPAVIVD